MFAKQTLKNDRLEQSIQEYLRFQKKLYGPNLPFDEKEEREKYLDSITLVINVIDRLLEKNNLSMEVLERILPNTARYLITMPEMPNLVYVKRDKYSSHFHLENGIVTEAENIHVLPNINSNIRKEKINSYFEGLTLLEARSLLCQMGILPTINDVDETLDTYHEEKGITEKFYRNIIERIIAFGDIEKAKLVAQVFGYPFDFEHYLEEQKTLKKVK